MSRRDRLTQEISEIEAHWQRLGVRLGRLRPARELETRVEEQLRLDALIAEVEASRATLSRELDTLEAQLSGLGAAAALPVEVGPQMVFWSCAQSDESLRRELLSCIESQSGSSGTVHFHASQVPPGAEPRRTIAEQLARARLILLLISADYLADDALDQDELRPAMLRHEAGEAIVIPIVVAPCDYSQAAFAKLQVLPKDGLPIPSFPDRESILRDVAARILKTLEVLATRSSPGLDRRRL